MPSEETVSAKREKDNDTNTQAHTHTRTHTHMLYNVIFLGVFR